MRAYEELDALKRVMLFRAQAADSNRRLEDIGGDLDSAISLLNLQQQQSCEALHPDGATAGVTHGVHRAVLDWSTGVIVKLAAALPKLSTTAASAAAASPNGGGSGSSERHARNSRRWLADPRIWRAFVRSLRAGTTTAAEPSTHLPQAASLGVLRAAVFVVRVAAGGTSAAVGAGQAGADECSASPRVPSGGDQRVGAAEVATAGAWAFVAILTLCGGVIVTAGEAGGVREAGGYSSGSMTNIDAAILDELLPHRVEAGVGARPASKRWGRGGALMKMSLDAYVAFLNEVIRGHVVMRQEPPPLGHNKVGMQEKSGGGMMVAAVGAAAVGGGALPLLAEGALTELLRFQVVLQAQQTTPRTVFATFCSKLMGSLFQILPLETSTTATATTTSPLESAAKALACDAVFHEEHLEGYREAFTAAEATAATSETAGSRVGGVDVDHLSANAPSRSNELNQLSDGGSGKKKRRRKNKGGDSGEAAGGGGGGKSPNRVCYQQQLLDEMATLAASSQAGKEGERSRLGAMAGAPLLLEGYIIRLGNMHREAVDIHEAAGTVAATAAVSAIVGKRSRSSGGIGVGLSPSPASQMFRLWSVLTSTLSRPLQSAPSSRFDGGVPQPRILLAFLRANNSMLGLLADHDVYRINEDWGGLEFDQLRSFSASLVRLATTSIADGSAGGSGRGCDSSYGDGSINAATAMVISGEGGTRAPGVYHTAADGIREEGVETEAAQEFLRAFSLLLGLNHNILHDDLRMVLRLTFEWAAVTPKVGATAASGLYAGVNGDGIGVLRSLAVGLVGSLVDTYGRLRQMDHLVRALFGAILDRPAAAAAVLRRDECTAALERAFRRLPEGQIESMWDVFAAHLREGWNRGGGGRNEVLAKEVDAGLFVVFVRNLHVTSSVASAVGKLCASLAEESLRSVGVPLQQAAAAAAVTASNSPARSSPKKRKRKKRKNVENDDENDDEDPSGAILAGPPADVGDRGGSGRGGCVPTSEMMVSVRPALDVHGWLLDLDTRCRFWSAVLDSSPSSSAIAPVTAKRQDDGDTPVIDDGGGENVGGNTTGASCSSPEAETTLPLIIAGAAAALKIRGSSSSSLADADSGQEEEEAGVRGRLEKTLQQVAVHRVQQVYARLNGVAALEAGVAELPPTIAASGESVKRGEVGGGVGGGKIPSKKEDARLEEEARGLVAFACAACGGGSGPVRWGDEDRDCGGGDGASWSMMMPYLPVWVGFAAEEQVALFLEAFFSKCASDILAGRGAEGSPPLRLLSDASFYEMEAIAQSAPAVILARVYRAVERATEGTGDNGDRNVETTGTSPRAFGSVDTIVAGVQALAKRAAEAGEGEGTEGGSSGSPDEATGRGDARRDGGHEEQELLEACCLLMMTERFPPGFLDEEAVAGLLVASDALDAVLTQCMISRGVGCGGGKKRIDDDATAPADFPSRRIVSLVTRHRAGLAEAVTALRGLALRLGRALPPESPLLDRLPHVDALLRLIGPGSGVRGGTGSRSLLRSSASLLPFLAERCVMNDDSKTALKAIVGLGLMRPRLVGESNEVAIAGGKRRRQRGHTPLAASSQKRKEGEGEDGTTSRRLVLLHGVLSGFVAGESRRLAKDAADAASAALSAINAARSHEFDSDHGDEGEEEDDNDDGLAGVIEGGPETTQPPRPAAALDQRLLATVSHLAGCLPAQATASRLPPASTAVSPPLLLVWSEALRLSFLGADTQRLVFADRKPGGVVRSRSRWVEDCVAYLAERAESLGAPSRSGRSAAPTPSERSAYCHLLRAVCGCSHLLDPPLPRLSIRRLVEAFIEIIDLAADSGGGGGDRFDAGRAAPRVQRAEEDLLLHTAFALLVQHASEAQLDEIVATLLEMFAGERAMNVVPKTPGLAARPTAVTLMRLATRAGRGAAFKAVVPTHALSLAAALCRQLRGAANRGCGGDQCDRLRSATGALEALEGLLDRQPYSSVTARVVSVVLGSVEPAARAALDAIAVMAARDGSRGGSTGREAFVVGESLRCFRACCRVLGTVLHHYARKVYSCTPPFASLCRTLLRLFFRLTSVPAPDPDTGGDGGGDGTRRRANASGAVAEADGDGRRSCLALSVEEQVAAASAFSRVLEQFVPHKGVLKKYAAFFLLEYVSLSGMAALEPAPKAALLSGVFAVMQACSRREMRQLHGLLGSLPTGTGLQVFRSLNEEYQLQHKYVGKM